MKCANERCPNNGHVKQLDKLSKTVTIEYHLCYLCIDKVNREIEESGK